MKDYTITQDIMYINFIRSKPTLSEASKKQYATTLNKFCEAVQQPLQKVISDCKNQQNIVTEKIISTGTDEFGNTITQKLKEEYDINNPNSLINLYLNTHINYCKSKGNKNVTLNHDLILITSFLGFYGIEIPSLEKFDDDTKKWNPLTKADFKFIMDDSTLSHKTLISLMKSTGMRLKDALDLKWEDIMKGASDYITCKDINEFADNAPADMVIKFKFYPQKTKSFKIPCLTFCDPETSNLLLQLLRKLISETFPRINKRKELDLQLSKKDPVFGSQQANFKKPPGANAISTIFWRKNKKLKEHRINIIDKKIQNNELSEEDRQDEIDKIPVFHAHGCRKFFETTVAKNCGNLRICALMEGHAPPLRTDSSYIKIDDETVKEVYMSAIPDLSLENAETRVYTSEIRKEMEEKINKLQDEVKEKEAQSQDMEERLSKMERLFDSVDQMSDEDILNLFAKRREQK